MNARFVGSHSGQCLKYEYSYMTGTGGEGEGAHCYRFTLVNGTVPRDFRLQVFFVIQFLQAPSYPTGGSLPPVVYLDLRISLRIFENSK
jgi:hypothetical protein